jgi:hypothetical protein
MLSQHCFDLAQLDPVPAHLYLLVQPSQVLQLSILQIPHQVSVRYNLWPGAYAKRIPE